MSQSSYARKMARLSARIFGEIARPTAPKSTKVVRIFSEKPKHLDGRVVDYYPPYKDLGMLFQTLRSYGLYRDEHQDFKEEMKRLRALRGKTKCKKGEGKRAMKRQSEGSR
ncbi:Small ribosomal subunit protein mS33 [Nucella lapillus]